VNAPSQESRLPARNWTRLDGVDLLRGLAIFFVLMNHVNMRLLIAKVPYTEGLPDQLVSSLVWNGQLGVQIFFAISGFLITTTTLKRWGPLSQISLRGFYVMRFKRGAPLVPALIYQLCPMVVPEPTAVDGPHPDDWCRPSVGGRRYATLIDENRAEAESVGINAIPAHIFGRRYLVLGAQPYEAFLQVIDRLREETAAG